jgi:hypothetical protein
MAFSWKIHAILKQHRFCCGRGNPAVIIIDVKFHAEEIAAFIHFIRHDMGNYEAFITVVGCKNDTLLAFGTNACPECPVQFEVPFAVLEPVR